MQFEIGSLFLLIYLEKKLKAENSYVLLSTKYFSFAIFIFKRPNKPKGDRNN